MKKLKDFKTKIENNIIYKILRGLLYVFVALLLVVIVVQKITHNNLSFGGFRVFMIVSESMKDEYNIGDILISKHVEAEDINIGDNITYLGSSGSFSGLVITHKVVEKRQIGDKYHFVTKGLANPISDPEITYDQVYGKVIYKTFIFNISTQNFIYWKFSWFFFHFFQICFNIFFFFF